jgi:transposase
MSYIVSYRMQSTCLPPIIDDYVGPEDPVRVYDAFVNALDLTDLGISIEPKPGADEYHPALLLKLHIYGCSYGIRSSRKLERACHHNVSFQWLMGGLKPDYRTIARFRTRYKDAIKKVLKQCVRVCIDLNLIEGNILFTDGSKFRANASISNTRTKEKCERALQRLGETIDRLIDECEQIDQHEEGSPSLVKIRQKITDKERLSRKIHASLQALQEGNVTSLNSTDGESVKAKTRQGTHACYNVQMNVDAKNGLIVHSEALSDCNDYNHLKEQVQRASENLGRQPITACADSGYSSIYDLKDIDAKIQVIVPAQETLVNERTRNKEQFGKNNFAYNEATDEYICPTGSRLKLYEPCAQRHGKHIKRYNVKLYKSEAQTCRRCPNFGVCTVSKSGRTIERSFYAKDQERILAYYTSRQGQEIYKLRKEKIEHVFGHMKRNLSAGQFMLRGKDKVDTEVAILSTCFNLSRLMTIAGIPKLLENLAA